MQDKQYSIPLNLLVGLIDGAMIGLRSNGLPLIDAVRALINKQDIENQQTEVTEVLESDK